MRRRSPVICVEVLDGELRSLAADPQRRYVVMAHLNDGNILTAPAASRHVHLAETANGKQQETSEHENRCGDRGTRAEVIGPGEPARIERVHERD